MRVLRMLALLPLVSISIYAALAQQTEVITIIEPGVYKLDELFKEADVVALVKIVSSDTEHYNRAVYKGEVVKSFKGVSHGAIIYFGPFIGERLGYEYILFLRSVRKPIVPKKTPTASYGTIHYLEIFNKGYTSMATSYECVFDGKETDERCDYGVRVCTNYIKLPDSVRAFPPEENDPPFGCRWVRKTVFLPLLDSLTKATK